MEEEDWKDSAACRGMDVSIFFPVRRRGMSTSSGADIARQICQGCAVQQECLDDVMENGPADCGIRAGLLPKQIRSMRTTPLNNGRASRFARVASQNSRS